MNGILFVVVVMLGLKAAWDNRNNVIVVHLPEIRTKKQQSRIFKSFRYIKTSKGIRCIEEQRYRVI